MQVERLIHMWWAHLVKFVAARPQLLVRSSDSAFYERDSRK